MQRIQLSQKQDLCEHSWFKVSAWYLNLHNRSVSAIELYLKHVLMCQTSCGGEGVNHLRVIYYLFPVH